MGILKTLLILVEVATCFLLIGVILLQRSKNEGMGGMAMGGGMGEQLFGSRTGNVLTRITIILGCVFMANTTLLAVLYSHSGQTQSIIERKAATLPVAPSANAPQPLAPTAPAMQPTAPIAQTVPALSAITPVETPSSGTNTSDVQVAPIILQPATPLPSRDASSMPTPDAPSPAPAGATP